MAYVGAPRKNVHDLNLPISIEKENRFGGKWGRVRIVDGVDDFTEIGKDWIENEFTTGWSVYNLNDNTAIDITGNTGEQITAVAHGLEQDDPYFVGPVAVGDVDALVYENNLMTFGKRPKYNRSIEYPIGGVQYAVNETLMVSGVLEAKWRTENLFQSFLGATCGWIDYSTGHMRWYNENDYDYPMDVRRNDHSITFTDVTTQAQQRSGFTTFTLLPAVATMAINDGPYICGGEIYNSIYFNVSELAVAGAGDPTFDIEYYSDSGWQDLTDFILEDDLGATHYFDQVNCTLHFVPPWDWIRASVANNTATTTYTDYGYLIRIVLNSAEVYQTTNPVFNYIALSHITPTYTIREYFTRGPNSDYTVVNGASPTKCEITIQKGEPVQINYDYVAKGYVPPHNMATCSPPSRTLLYKQPLFYSPKDIDVTWSSPTVNDIHIENCKIIIDSRGDGVPYVDNDCGISAIDKSVPELRFECDIPYTNDTFLAKYFADPTTDDGQIDIAVTLHKEKLIATGLSADPAATDKVITIADVTAVHEGQVLALKETGLATTYLIVASVNRGTGVITFTTTLGVNFSTAAYVYLVDYYKFTYKNCIFMDIDLDDKVGDAPIKRSWVLQPLGDLPTTVPLDIDFIP